MNNYASTCKYVHAYVSGPSIIFPPADPRTRVHLARPADPAAHSTTQQSRDAVCLAGEPQRGSLLALRSGLLICDHLVRDSQVSSLQKRCHVVPRLRVNLSEGAGCTFPEAESPTFHQVREATPAHVKSRNAAVRLVFLLSLLHEAPMLKKSAHFPRIK